MPFIRAQRIASDNELKIIARPSPDSVVLRWAPSNSKLWFAGNKQGYIIERYTLVRNGKALTTPERKTLSKEIIKPYEELVWEKIIQNNKYVAIAAQALLGETFQLNLGNGGALSVVNKMREDDQRFSIALFCADLSIPAAKALGLYLADRDIVKGERYLYRITVAGSGSMKGDVFVDPAEKYVLPVPDDFSLKAEGNAVTLQWNQSHHKNVYTAYIAERSEDGKTFIPFQDGPVVTLTSGKDDPAFQYTQDTIPVEGKDFYYRVKGLTPFGETGPPSESKKIRSGRLIKEIPHIVSVISTDNKTMDINWEYPQELREDIEGFAIEKSTSSSGAYVRNHTGLIGKEIRTFRDNTPYPSTYYRVLVFANDKSVLKSFSYFAHLIDSIPPAAPEGVKGTVDEFGNVTLEWTPNTEPDIFGYRVYRANYSNEEFSQVTNEPIPVTQFKDRVQVLKSLNEKIHYQVMAIDKSQNHSTLSLIYTLMLPDKVPPVKTAFLPVHSDTSGVSLSWLPSGSKDVVRYELYRKAEPDLWARIISISEMGDSLYSYKDLTLKNGEQRIYTVVAVDKTGLESEPSEPVTGQRIRKSVWPALALKEPLLDRAKNKITLQWEYTHAGIKNYEILKAVNNEPLRLYRSVQSKEFVDAARPGDKYIYKVVAVFTDGSRSALGQGVAINY